MTATDAPACPRCADGGTVKLIDPQEDASVFSPLPAHPGAQVYQCTTCGWATLVKAGPPQNDSNRAR
jgi:hypothetical protein